jgi:hypothetical protein
VIFTLVLLSLCSVVSFAAEPRTEPKSPVAGGATSQAAPAHPEVVLDVTRRDYGEVFAGEELDFPFNILNAGKAPLELMQRALSSRASTPAPSLAVRLLHGAEPRYSLVPVTARLAAPS